MKVIECVIQHQFSICGVMYHEVKVSLNRSKASVKAKGPKAQPTAKQTKSHFLFMITLYKKCADHSEKVSYLWVCRLQIPLLSTADSTSDLLSCDASPVQIIHTSNLFDSSIFYVPHLCLVLTICTDLSMKSALQIKCIIPD